MQRLCQRPQAIVETNRPADEKGVISDAPSYTELAIGVHYAPVRVLFSPVEGWANVNDGLDPSPKTRKPTPVTKCMNEDDSEERACAKIHKRRIPTKNGGKAELEDRSKRCSEDWGIRMG
jgi:hypothetical protein